MTQTKILFSPFVSLAATNPLLAQAAVGTQFQLTKKSRAISTGDGGKPNS